MLARYMHCVCDCSLADNDDDDELCAECSLVVTDSIQKHVGAQHASCFFVTTGKLVGVGHVFSRRHGGKGNDPVRTLLDSIQ